jgi:phosphocarrier protein
MGLLMLVASKGTQVNIKTEGVQAQELLNALGVLIANRFGEDQ